MKWCKDCFTEVLTNRDYCSSLCEKNHLRAKMIHHHEKAKKFKKKLRKVKPYE